MARRSRLAVLALAALLAAGCGRVVQLDLPDLDAVPVRPPEQSYVYDADGNRLAVLRHQHRERVSLEDVPQVLRDAVVAAEDQRFRTHGGVDARAVLRAAARNVAAGETVQGGSTITQQLVKNLYMPRAPRTAATKLREALLAHRMEQERSKDEILEEYLNTVYLGSGAYGVQAAARTYWRRDVAELDLAQAAMLAGMIRRPESLDPAERPEPARARRRAVLDRMVAEGLIDRDRAERAADAPLTAVRRPPSFETREPHWVDLVVRTLLDDPSFGATERERTARLFGGGLRIHTTLDPVRQAAARRTIAETLPDPGDPDAAIVTVEPDTGHIVAAAGSRAYDELQFDLATQARRQPGSTFKAFVLTAAVTAGMHPDTLVNGNQGTLQTTNGPWTVRNYGRTSYGSIPLREATRASVNAAFARLTVSLGPGRIASLARAMGVESPINHDPPIALGALERGVTPVDMAAGYATLANLGERVPTTPIDRIETAGGQVVWRPSGASQRAVGPSVAYVTTGMLREVVERGTGRAAALPGRQVAGKTGTTSDHADAWFVGYTPTLSTAVWVGHASGRVPMGAVHGVAPVTGGSWPARMWHDYMLAALAGQPPEPFVLDDTYRREVQIDPETGLLAAPWCPGEPTSLPRVLVPEETCPSPAPAPSPEPTTTAPPTTPSPTATGPTGTPTPGAPSPSPEPTATSEPTATPEPTARPEPTEEPSTAPSDEPTTAAPTAGT